jgi:hypothetical protein
MTEPVCLSYGGGVNSTAIIAGWVERELPIIDRIIFSDTGGERPETYAYVDMLSAWLVVRGWPEIITVKKVLADHKTVESLEENCLRHETLPSLAYGFKRCSHKFKRQPSDKNVNHWHRAKTAWQSGYKVVKLIGFDAGEAHRAARATDDDKYRYRYPLIEWGWDRDECVASIGRVGLPVHGKSSCFFCPASTKPEIKELEATHPLLFQRALAIEARAAVNFQTVKGLGRRFAWRDMATVSDDTCTVEQDCGCYDG